MKMKSLLRFSLLFCAANPAFAFFCPTNFSQIELGNSVQQVIQACGTPTTQNTVIKSVYRSQEWVYYVKTSPFSQNTSKLNVVLLNDQVVNITITENAQNCQPMFPGDSSDPKTKVVCIPTTTQETKSIGSTNACGPMIRLGSTADQVQAACGQAAFVNHGQQADAQITYTELFYRGTPDVSLIFENGVLKNRV